MSWEVISLSWYREALWAQMEASRRRRRRRRVASSTLLGASIFLMVATLVVIASPLLTLAQQYLALALGAMAGAAISASMYLSEAPPPVPPGGVRLLVEVSPKIASREAESLSDLDRAILRICASSGGLRLSETAEKLGIPPSLLAERLSRLEREGFLRVVGASVGRS